MTVTITAPVTVVAGENLPNAVADVAVLPPDGWEQALRAVNPITTIYSHLRFYWYRAKARWVLYDCVPKCLMPEDGSPPGVPMEMKELLGYLNGPPARELGENACPFVSDVQHEFWHRYGVYARPYWVLQGDRGGHQVKFSPWQTNVAMKKGLPHEPPAIGTLPFAPFDNRTAHQLNHFNRLHALDDRLEHLMASGSREAMQAEMDAIQKEIRLAETAFIEQQFEFGIFSWQELGIGRIYAVMGDRLVLAKRSWV